MRLELAHTKHASKILMAYSRRHAFEVDRRDAVLVKEHVARLVVSVNQDREALITAKAGQCVLQNRPAPVGKALGQSTASTSMKASIERPQESTCWVTVSDSGRTQAVNESLAILRKVVTLEPWLRSCGESRGKPHLRKERSSCPGHSVIRK